MGFFSYKQPLGRSGNQLGNGIVQLNPCGKQGKPPFNLLILGNILKFDWLRATLLSGGGFTLQPRVLWWRTLYMDEKMTWMPTWRTLFRRGVLWRSSFLGNLNSSDKKLDLWRTPTWIKYFTVFSSSPAYSPLPQITMSWAKVLDRPVHFSTVV